jgi:hypothetical protein
MLAQPANHVDREGALFMRIDRRHGNFRDKAKRERVARL